jgi:hypothetical protein
MSEQKALYATVQILLDPNRIGPDIMQNADAVAADWLSSLLRDSEFRHDILDWQYLQNSDGSWTMWEEILIDRDTYEEEDMIGLVSRKGLDCE